MEYDEGEELRSEWGREQQRGGVRGEMKGGRRAEALSREPRKRTREVMRGFPKRELIEGATHSTS
jgi:hypothetical protein